MIDNQYGVTVWLPEKNATAFIGECLTLYDALRLAETVIINPEVEEVNVYERIFNHNTLFSFKSIQDIHENKDAQAHLIYMSSVQANKPFKFEVGNLGFWSKTCDSFIVNQKVPTKFNENTGLHNEFQKKCKVKGLKIEFDFDAKLFNLLHENKVVASNKYYTHIVFFGFLYTILYDTPKLENKDRAFESYKNLRYFKEEWSPSEDNDSYVIWRINQQILSDVIRSLIEGEYNE